MDNYIIIKEIKENLEKINLDLKLRGVKKITKFHLNKILKR